MLAVCVHVGVLWVCAPKGMVSHELSKYVALCSDPRKWLVKGARYRLNWSVVVNEDVHVP